MATKKGRIWATISYPESRPDDWIEKLQETGLQIAISPLHNKDINPDGTPKKEHNHIILVYDGPTTYKHVENLCKSLNMTIPIKLESLRGMYRYHIHLDNPEKYQYKDSERILLNGFETDADKLTENEEIGLLLELIEFIEENTITEYRDLIYILKSTDHINLTKVAMKKTIMLNTYIKSFKYKIKEEKEKIKKDIDNKDKKML